MKKLTEFKSKTIVLIKELKNEINIIKKLKIIGLIPGKKIKIILHTTGKEPLIIQIDESRFAVSKNIAKDILGEEVN